MAIEQGLPALLGGLNDGNYDILTSEFIKLLVQSFCDSTSHKLQQKQTQQFLIPYHVLTARKKVLRNPRGGSV